MSRFDSVRRVGAYLTMPKINALLILGISLASIAFFNQHQTNTLHAVNVSSTTTTTSNFTISELGVHLVIPSDLAADGLEYDAQVNRPVTSADNHPWSTAAFTSKALLALDSRCTADQVSIGMIVQYSEDPATIHADVTSSFARGSHYYGFVSPQEPCSDNSAAVQLQLKETNELEQAFSSLATGN